jgi:magnesium-transporting ATPase (P-type)
MKDFHETELSDSSKTDGLKAIRTIYQLLILMAIEYVISIAWFILQKVIIPVFFEKEANTDWTKISLLYKNFGWTMDILSVIAILIFSIIIPNKIARIFLLVFLGLKVMLIIGYRILEQH